RRARDTELYSTRSDVLPFPTPRKQSGGSRDASQFRCDASLELTHSVTCASRDPLLNTFRDPFQKNDGSRVRRNSILCHCNPSSVRSDLLRLSCRKQGQCVRLRQWAVSVPDARAFEFPPVVSKNSYHV